MSFLLVFAVTIANPPTPHPSPSSNPTPPHPHPTTNTHRFDQLALITSYVLVLPQRHFCTCKSHVAVLLLGGVAPTVSVSHCPSCLYMLVSFCSQRGQLFPALMLFTFRPCGTHTIANSLSEKSLNLGIKRYLILHYCMYCCSSNNWLENCIESLLLRLSCEYG